MAPLIPARRRGLTRVFVCDLFLFLQVARLQALLGANGAAAATGAAARVGGSEVEAEGLRRQLGLTLNP